MSLSSWEQCCLHVLLCRCISNRMQRLITMVQFNLSRTTTYGFPAHSTGHYLPVNCVHDMFLKRHIMHIPAKSSYVSFSSRSYKQHFTREPGFSGCRRMHSARQDESNDHLVNICLLFFGFVSIYLQYLLYFSGDWV